MIGYLTDTPLGR